jgi:hypothetical protein
MNPVFVAHSGSQARLSKQSQERVVYPTNYPGFARRTNSQLNDQDSMALGTVMKGI